MQPPAAASVAAGPGHTSVAVVVESSVAADTACPAVAEQSGGPADPTGPACPTAPTDARCRAAIATGATLAEEPAAGPAIAAEGAGPAATAGTAVADQPCRPAGAAGDAGGGAGAAVAAVAEEQPAIPAGLSGGPVGTVADQRAPQQRLGGGTDRRQHVLRRRLQRRDVRRLGGRVGAPRAGQRLYELGMKRPHLNAETLIGLRMSGEQRRHRGGYLVGAGGQYRGSGSRSRGVGRADRCADTVQVCCCRRQNLWRGYQKRHC